MGLLGTTTEQAYYSQSQTFTGDGSGSSGTVAFTLTTAFFPTLPTAETQFDVFADGTQLSSSLYSYSSPNLDSILPFSISCCIHSLQSSKLSSAVTRS